VDIAMFLEVMLGGGGTSTRMVQVQSHFSNITMKLQDMVKDKVVQIMFVVLCAGQKVTIGMSVLCWRIT
jgi:hypothetical protein